MKKALSIKRIIKSFGYAINGIKETFLNEPNMKVHTLMALLVIICGFFFKVNTFEWIILLLLIALVLAGEVLNTSLEHLSDLYSTKFNDKIKIIKDTAAGFVLIMALFSVIIGLIIFIPKLLELIGV